MNPFPSPLWIRLRRSLEAPMVFRIAWIIHGILVVLAVPLLCQAAVQGSCSDCHTMHNSQQGTSVAFTRDSSGQEVSSDQPFANLLKTDCLGCHSHGGAETIVQIGGSKSPVVLNFTEPTYPPNGSPTSALAGGNFHWMTGGGDAYGHNVAGISEIDFRFPPNLAPGGMERPEGCADCHGTLASAGSGCEGCHVPHHHAGNSDDLASRENGWYRFLGSVMQSRELQLRNFEPTPEGVLGLEAPDWEQDPLPDQHNTYKGKAGPYTSYLESGSLSQKCIGCHGLFHVSSTADSTWIRHPVDVAIPNSGEFTGMTAYNPLAPVARQSVGSETDGSIILGSDMVSCISCHRPHGSPYPAMLRWGYRDWPGTDSHTGQPAFNGCAVCHTSKD